MQLFSYLFCACKVQDVLAARLIRLEAQFQSEIARLKDGNKELKVQLEKANERIYRLEGKSKAVDEDENSENHG